MRLDTEAFVLHDTCQRLRTWDAQYQPFRIPLSRALNDSLHYALSEGEAIRGREKLISLATSPGIDLPTASLYSSVVHHAAMIEVIAQYLLSITDFKPLLFITRKWGQFQPLSFLTQGNRIQRIILCDRWNADRAKAESISWRTLADSAITNLPMTLTAIIIGQSRGGFRLSPWTTGFAHPRSGEIMVQKRDGEPFSDVWRRTYREQTDHSPLDWLTIMQRDNAFDSRVFSLNLHTPPNRAEILQEIDQRAAEMALSPRRQTHSACLRFSPCPFLDCCAANRAPAQLGWKEKTSPSPLPLVSSQ